MPYKTRIFSLIRFLLITEKLAKKERDFLLLPCSLNMVKKNIGA